MSVPPLREKARKEIMLRGKMCQLIPWGEGAGMVTGCEILSAALVSAKSTLAKGSPRRVFIQDLTTALDRRNLLKKGKYDEFQNTGQEYMEV